MFDFRFGLRKFIVTISPNIYVFFSEYLAIKIKDIKIEIESCRIVLESIEKIKITDKWTSMEKIKYIHAENENTCLYFFADVGVLIIVVNPNKPELVFLYDSIVHDIRKIKTYTEVNTKLIELIKIFLSNPNKENALNVKRFCFSTTNPGD